MGVINMAQCEFIMDRAPTTASSSSNLAGTIPLIRHAPCSRLRGDLSPPASPETARDPLLYLAPLRARSCHLRRPPKSRPATREDRLSAPTSPPNHVRPSGCRARMVCNDVVSISFIPHRDLLLALMCPRLFSFVMKRTSSGSRSARSIPGTRAWTGLDGTNARPLNMLTSALARGSPGVAGCAIAYAKVNLRTRAGLHRKQSR